MKSPPPAAPRNTIRFAAELAPPGTNAKTEAAGRLLLPKPASARLRSRGATTIEATINGFPFRAALEPDGGDRHALHVTPPLRKAAEAELGDTVTVEITRLEEEPETRLPSEWQQALAANPRAQATWAATTPAARRDWILWICSGKLPSTRQIRIEKGCDMLAKGKRRVCCFGGLGWLRKDHAAAGENWRPLPKAKATK